ncbi:major facilitator superfamily domain-containing protein 4B-like isoform X2 [Babylonia areolata]
MSYIFLLQGFGALFGNLTALFPERYFDRRLLVAVYVLLGSVVNVVIPLKANYVYMLIFFLLQGIAKGMTDFAAISLCNALWEENKALPFQFIIIGAGIGTFISPLIAQPFIKAQAVHSVSSASEQLACTKAAAANVTLPLLTSHGSLTLPLLTSQDNVTAPTLTSQNYGGDLDGLFNVSDAMFWPTGDGGNGTGMGAVVNEDIKWPFIIAGLVTFPASLAFLYFYCVRPKLPEELTSSEEMNCPAAKPATEDSSLVQQRQGRPPAWAVYVFRGVLILLHMPVFGLNLALADLLTSIGMMPPLCMGAREASHFTTVLWGTSMVSRALGVLFLLCFPVFVHLVFNSVLMVVLGAVLLGGIGSNVPAMWVGTAGLGLFDTNFMPAYIAWSGDYLPITPLFMNLSLCMAGVGELVLPFVCGQLLAACGPRVMMGLLMAVLLLMLILFLFVVFLGKRFLKGSP